MPFAALLLVLTLLAACASTSSVPVRPATAEETRGVEQALVPLLGALDPPMVIDCPIGLGIVPARAINAGIGLAPAKNGCQSFTLVVTEGSLRRLTLDMLRAALAHELGHVRLGHLEARRERGTTRAVLRPFTVSFDRAQEAEADRFAVSLLRRLEPRQPGACLALVYVLAQLAEQPGWLSTHPSPDRRAESVLAGCNAP
ncbi:MAG TPA: M48 family metalloprotease [Methylomirabilota bacterium]|nr:M48 family metalloprotease [Methylomirabilota bacterium]